MSKKLIERARNAKTSLGASLHFGLCAELADCVEKLEAEIAELRQQLATSQSENIAYASKLAAKDEEIRHISAGWGEANNSLLSCRMDGIGLRDELQRQLAAFNDEVARQQLDAERLEIQQCDRLRELQFEEFTKQIAELRQQVTLMRDELNTVYKLVPDLVPVMQLSALAAT